MKHALLLPLVLLACKEPLAQKANERRDTIASARVVSPAENLFSAQVLSRALDDLFTRVGRSPAFLSVELLRERAHFEIESTTAPGEVVEYEWHAGELRGPARLELRGKGSLQQNLFLPASIDFASIPTLLETARTRVDAENGVVSRVLIRRNLPADDTVGIRVYVDSPLRSSHVDADSHGRLVESGRYP
ncbi:MAG: hypothetical protein ACOY0T_36755 [Myxococcota bacterium]